MENTTTFEKIDFTTLEAQKKKVIQFAKDGNKVVKHWKELYRLSDITEVEAHKYFYIENCADEYGVKYFPLWNDTDAICFNYGSVMRFWTIQECIEKLACWIKLSGLEGFKTYIFDAMENKYYVNNCMIETLVLNNELELAKQCSQYRLDYIQAREQKEEMQRAERERKEREEEEARKKEISETVDAAEDAIRSHKTLYNDDLEETTIILYLMKKHGVKVPLKTQGWINKALSQIIFTDNGISYKYYSSSRNSTVFRNCLLELEEKILNIA